MSETAFTIADNSFQNSSGGDENSSESPDQFLRQWLRERHADRIETALKQSRNTTHDTEIIETTIEDSETSIGIDLDISSIINFPNLAQVSQAWSRVSTFHALQEWEGYVIEIGEDDFTVRLLDLTAGSSHEEEEAVILLSEISEDDLKRLRLGSVFRWVIGYARSASGTKRRVSEVVFRELPVVTKQDIAEAEERARKTAQLWAK